MFYLVAAGNAYAMDSSTDTMYGMTCYDDNTVDINDAYDIAYDEVDEDDQEYLAHLAYHMQQIVKLTEEHAKDIKVFVK
jgi:hypothetical protein